MKNELNWVSSLRNSKPDEKYMQSLKEFVLSFNEF